MSRGRTHTHTHTHTHAHPLAHSLAPLIYCHVSVVLWLLVDISTPIITHPPTHPPINTHPPTNIHPPTNTNPPTRPHFAALSALGRARFPAAPTMTRATKPWSLACLAHTLPASLLSVVRFPGFFGGLLYNSDACTHTRPSNTTHPPTTHLPCRSPLCHFQVTDTESMSTYDYCGPVFETHTVFVVLLAGAMASTSI